MIAAIFFIHVPKCLIVFQEDMPRILLRIRQPERMRQYKMSEPSR